MNRDEIPADLEWLARNVSEWPSGLESKIFNEDGILFNHTAYGSWHYVETIDGFDKPQWLQARQLLGLAPVDVERWSDWIEWVGGECPVSKHASVCWRGVGGREFGPITADYLDWSNSGLSEPIEAYCYRLDDNTATPEEEEEWEVMEEKQNRQKYSAYFKDVRHLDYIDVYRTVSLFDCEKHGHAISHAAKKLLLTGVRTGGKNVEQEVQEAIDTLTRWLEMKREDASALRAGELGE